MVYPDIKQHSSALRQAVISIIPDFYQYSGEERYRLFNQLTHDQNEQFDLALSQRLFNQPYQHEDLNEEQMYLFNHHLLPLQGVGEDCFFLNESFADDKPMPSFATLRDYDYDDWEFQETSREKDSPDYQRETDYYGRLNNVWGRCLNTQGKLQYLNLSTVSCHLTNLSDDMMDNLLDRYIPHEWIEGPDNGKFEKGGEIWDFKIDANGLEGQLDWLRRRCFRHLAARRRYHEKAFSTYSPEVIWIDCSKEQEKNAEVLFINHHTLAAIRLDHFLEDCQLLLAKSNSLAEWEQDEKAWCTELVKREYDHVMQHYDPSIVEFKKQKKIIVTNDVLDNI